MKKTIVCEQPDFKPCLWDTTKLKANCGCGRATAIKIGEAAGAKVKIGKRCLWSASKVQAYLDSIAE
jgi:hypothetical protein